MEKSELQQMLQNEVNKIVTDRVKEAVNLVQSIRGHASLLGPEAVAMVEQSFQRKIPVTEILNQLLDMAGVTTKGKTPEAQAEIQSFKQISDADFYRALADPATHKLDGTAQGKGGPAGFREITDDEFFAGLSNPAQYGG